MRIAVITQEFPNQRNPTVGPALYEATRALAKLCDVRVFCVTARYPSASILQPKTYQVATLATDSPPGVDVRYLTFRALPWVSRPINGWTCRRSIQAHIAAWNPDLILAYFLYPQGCAAVAIGEALNLPVVLVALGSDLLRLPNWLAKRQVSRAVRNADAVTAVSQHLIRRAIEMGADPSTAVTIRNGCDSDVFYPLDRASARLPLGVPTDQRLVLFVGRFVQLKGMEDLLQALNLLRSRNQIVHLACIGQGPMLDSWRHTAKQLNVENQVSFLGTKSSQEIAQWLGASDMLCLPSHSEGSPSVILEALSSGRPVVATNVGGIPDQVSGESGALVSPGSPEQLAAALEQVLNGRWDAEAIRARAERTWSDVGRETFELCSRVLAKR